MRKLFFSQRPVSQNVKMVETAIMEPAIASTTNTMGPIVNKVSILPLPI